MWVSDQAESGNTPERIWIWPFDPKTMGNGSFRIRKPYEDSPEYVRADLVLEMAAALEARPILSKYHGKRGFEYDQFATDYDAFRSRAAQALARFRASGGATGEKT